MLPSRRAGLVLVAMMSAPLVAGGAQAPAVKIKEETPGLLRRVKISPDSAIHWAQAKFPSGTIKSGELEREKGKLIYTFDIQVPGVSGIEEVNVDAATGAITTEHENPPPPKPARPKKPALA